MVSLPLDLGAALVRCEAASEEPQSSAEVLIRMEPGVQIKESSWKEVVPKRLKQQKGEGRKMQEG